MGYLVLMTEETIDQTEINTIIRDAGDLPGKHLHYQPYPFGRVDDEEFLKACAVRSSWPFPKTTEKITGSTQKGIGWCLWIVNPEDDPDEYNQQAAQALADRQRLDSLMESSGLAGEMRKIIRDGVKKKKPWWAFWRRS